MFANYDIVSVKGVMYDMSKYYYLKYYDKTVAEINVDNKTMEIINLDLFFDRRNKNIMK